MAKLHALDRLNHIQPFLGDLRGLAALIVIFPPPRGGTGHGPT
jgi:hypothetical protein